jgi:hypothetical protein
VFVETPRHTRHCEERSDEAIQRARSAQQNGGIQRRAPDFLARLPARSWIASLRSQ